MTIILYAVLYGTPRSTFYKLNIHAGEYKYSTWQALMVNYNETPCLYSTFSASLKHCSFPHVIEQVLYP